MKTITTPTLIRLNDRAIRMNRNRTLKAEWLRRNLDPDGFHIINQVLFHNDMEWRCLVMMKISGQTEPMTGYLDISPGDWERVEKEDAKIREVLRQQDANVEVLP